MIRRLFQIVLWVCLASLGSLPAQARWLKAETQNFIIYSEESEVRLRDRAQELEGFQLAMRILTGTTAPPSPVKLPLYIVRGSSRFNQVGGVRRGVGGFYSASPDGLIAVADERTAGTGLQDNEVLFHEYAHHFMLQYHPAAYPPWYVEGFAEYMMTARVEPDRMEIGGLNRGRSWLLADLLSWMPAERVLFHDGGPLSDADEARFYGQSWLMTHYFMSNPERNRQLGTYLRAISSEEEPRAAFQRVFQIPPQELQSRLKHYARGRISFSRIRGRPLEASEIRITELPGSADNLLLRQAAMRRGRLGSESQLLADIRQEASQHGDDFAKRVLAEAEARYGDAATADRLLGELLAGSPDDPQLLYLRGLRHLIAADRDKPNGAGHVREARTWFARAHRADPHHFPSLYRYAETFAGDPGGITDNVANVIVLAHQLAPQVDEIRVNAAMMLLARERWDEADAVLSPLIGSPHAGSFAAAARELLQKARARDNEGVMEEGDPAAAAAEPDGGVEQ